MYSFVNDQQLSLAKIIITISSVLFSVMILSLFLITSELVDGCITLSAENSLVRGYQQITAAKDYQQRLTWAHKVKVSLEMIGVRKISHYTELFGMSEINV